MRSYELIRWNNMALDLDSKVAQASIRVIKRGQVFWCEFGENIGSEQCEERPALILRGDALTSKSSNTIVAPITHRASTLKENYPLNSPAGASVDGYVLLGNIVTISKARLKKFICNLSKQQMRDIDDALAYALGLDTYKQLQTAKGSIQRLTNDKYDLIRNLTQVKKELGLDEKANMQTIIRSIQELKAK